jgi:hypothetical protein
MGGVSRPAPKLTVVSARQRELMSQILAAARESSAGFHAAFTVVAAHGEDEPRRLARELLTDLSIRRWIEFCATGAHGEELPIPRIRSEAQFIDPANWQPHGPPTRYRLTQRGRAELERLVA